MNHKKLLLMTICVIFYLFPLAVFADQNESRVEKQTEISPDPDQTEHIGDILNLSKSSSFTVGCPTQSLFGQQFQAPTDTNWIASTSDNGAIGSILVFDNFVSTGSINQICFWGINGYYTGDSWYVCYESPMAFQIRFYSDSNGGPDALVASYDVNCVGNQTGLIYRGAFELYQYYADLPVSVEMDKGWITIQGIDGNPECWFEWMSSADGYDSHSLQWDGVNLNNATIDRAFCLQHQEYLCGDIDGDNDVNLYDIIHYIYYRYKGGPPPVSMLTADVNSDGIYNILDIVVLCSYKYKNGPPPVCPIETQ